MTKVAAIRHRLLLVHGFLFSALLNVPAAALDVEAIAVTGDTAPGGGTFAGFGSFPSIRNDGTVAFSAGIAGGDGGIFLWSNGSGFSALRRVGDMAPSGALYTSLSLHSAHALNGSGDVAGFAMLDDGSSGIFVFSASGDSQIALVGDPAPGTSYSFTDFWSVGLSDTGAVAWYSRVSGCSQRPFCPDSGVYANFGSGNVAIANVGDTVFEATVKGFGHFGTVAVNATSQVGYSAFFSEPLCSAIILDAAGSPAIGIQKGDFLPGTGGGSFGGLTDEFPGLSDSGNIAFTADVIGGSTARGVFAITANGLRKIAVDGDPVPTEGPFGTFGFFPNDFMNAVVNDAGDVVFTPRVGEGLYYDFVGLGLMTVAQEGWLAPGTSGGTFGRFQNAAISDAGVVFASPINGGSGGGGIFLVPRDSVPAMSPFAWGGLGAALLAAATVLLRHGGRQRRQA